MIGSIQVLDLGLANETSQSISLRLNLVAREVWVLLKLVSHNDLGFTRRI